jgi:hypothetical protein
MNIDADMIGQAVRTLYREGDVFEVRVLEAETPTNRRPHTLAGYFERDKVDELAGALHLVDTAAGVYVTLNPVLPDLLARCANRLQWSDRGTQTKDEHIVSRRWLPIDCDPVRPAGISSTDAEKSTAIDAAAKVQAGLCSMGWPSPACIDSGNGYHLLYPIDVATDDDGLIHQVLRAIARASSDAVKIDTAVANPARIWRLPGTWNRKGDDMPGRPHRRAVLMDAPDTLGLVEMDDLRAMAQYAPKETPRKTAAARVATQGVEADARPGDVFNETGDLRAVLIRHGWTLSGGGDNEHWARPGKTSGTSATFDGTTFYVFSSSAHPFEANEGYTPFAAMALLEHGGDMSAAARSLADGMAPREIEMAPGVDLSLLMESINARHTAAKPGKREKTLPVDDPGMVPDDLLNVPGFIGELMDYTLASAPYPSRILAFAGAMCLQSHLAARKVRDSSDNRTNLYVLALANSGTGKEHPRRVNTRILHEIGAADSLGGRFVSGEGLQDALVLSPAMLFQTDEIDGLVNSITKSKDMRNESIMTALLEIYTSAASIVPVRKKAGAERAMTIDQPCVTIMGSAVPKHYYEALSERMLTNGLFARFMVFEAGKRSMGQDVEIMEIPAGIIEAAKWWSDFNPGGGNLAAMHPQPMIVKADNGAKRTTADLRAKADEAYAECERRDDPVGMTVWSRVGEQARKLALIRAISEDRECPIVRAADIEWATAITIHQARRMLYMATMHVASSPFEAEALRIVGKIKSAHTGEVTHSALLKFARMPSREFDAMIATLIERGDIMMSIDDGSSGRPGRKYIAG